MCNEYITTLYTTPDATTNATNTADSLTKAMTSWIIEGTRKSILNPKWPFQSFFKENQNLMEIFNHCNNNEYCTEENSTEENSTEENNEGRNFTINIWNKKYHLLDVNLKDYSNVTFDWRCQIWITKDPRIWELDSKFKSFIEQKQTENKQRHMITKDEFKDLYEGLRNKIKWDLWNEYELNDDNEKKLLLSYVTWLKWCYIITTNDEYYLSRIPPVWGFRNYVKNEEDIIYGFVLLVSIEDIKSQNS